MPFAGIDIGSRTTKLVVVNQDGVILESLQADTGARIRLCISYWRKPYAGQYGSRMIPSRWVPWVRPSWQ